MIDTTMLADAGDQLRALLAANGVDSPVAASAALAGEQLELLRPYFMMPTRAGIVSGPRAAVESGTILFVISDGRRVATSHIIPASPAAEMFTAGAAGLLEGTPRADWENAIVGVMTIILDKAGGAPGAAPETAIDEREMLRLFFALLATLPTKAISDLGHAMDRVRDEGICPALVGLLGPASSGSPNHFSVAWPLALPLAPYIEDAVQ
jgi:hypothetical protein